MTHHCVQYSDFDGEEPVRRTFRMTRDDWKKLLDIREQLLASHGIKLSVNATLVHVLHLHGKAAESHRS